MAVDQRITEALDLLQKRLMNFVEERMRVEYKDGWLEKARLSLADFRTGYRGSVNLDVQALIRIATDKQHQILYNSLLPRERSFLHELRDVRNRHAHQERFEERDVERALDTLELFLKAIHSPEAEGAFQRRRRIATSSHEAAARSDRLDPGATGVERGVRLLRYLAEQANGGRAVGISYGDFIAFLHQKSTFREVAGRNYLPSDSGAVIELACSITAANGGRIVVSQNGRTIRCGMDTFIWASSSPHDRPEKAWLNRKFSPPYSRADWKALFPDGLRRMITENEWARLK